MDCIRNLAVVFVITLLTGCGALGAKKDGMCVALRAFAESIPAGGSHLVTLQTQWGEEWSAACERIDAPPEVALCAYLVNHTSWEYMSLNVRHALQCLDVRFPRDLDGFYFETLSGTVQSDRASLTKRHVKVELSFNTDPKNGSPFLTFAVTAVR